MATPVTLNLALQHVRAGHPQRDEFATASALPEAAAESAPDFQLESTDRSILGLVELILKDRLRLEWLIRQGESQPVLVPRLLLISLCSFLLFGVALSVTLDAAGVWPRLTAMSDVFPAAEQGRSVPFLQFTANEVGTSHWRDGSALRLLAAYSLGLIAATGICLPSLYFYGLLAGVRMPMRDVVLHSLKAKATGAIALIGILPVYAAIAIGIVVLTGASTVRGPSFLLQSVLWLGLILPFVGGLFGTWSMYRGFLGLADTLPADRREHRECFLNRLALSWIGVYTAVSPVMIFTLWEFFGRAV